MGRFGCKYVQICNRYLCAGLCVIPLYPSPLPRAIFTQGTKRLSEYIGHEAAVRAGTGYFMGLAVDHSREALVAGYLLIATTQSACPPTHFVKGQLQPACNGLGNVFRLIDERIASQQMALSIWKVSSPPSQIGCYGIHQWVDDSYYSHSLVSQWRGGFLNNRVLIDIHFYLNDSQILHSFRPLPLRSRRRVSNKLLLL